MKYILATSVLAIGIISCAQLRKNNSEKLEKTEAVMDESTKRKDELGTMPLGAFSLSLAVKDLKVSRTFYENLGFEVLAGSMESNYLIMKNGQSLIGLFQGMFEGNILTFNPGWDENGENLEQYTDIRLIQKHLKGKGIELDTEADATTTGPASVVLKDPDGNMILLDQHR